MKSRVLIADDNLNILQTLKDVLEENGYHVDTVKDGYEVLAHLKENTTDVIILDLMMPHKNGTEIICAIKSISPNTKTIVYTGFQKYKHFENNNCVDKFILKGSGFQELLEVLEEVQKGD